jgi:serine/threonine-protein kinase
VLPVSSRDCVSTPVLEPGSMLMQYRLIERIGSGGMGDVWKATDTRLNREVAIKLIDAEHVADPERRRRLLREAQLASALNHPNTVTIYDVHSGEPADFIAMEYVPGMTLRQLLQEGRIGLKQALDYGIQIASGIAAAHASGIVHRDIKPGNVMVANDGRVRVLDFGLARLAEQAAGAACDDQFTGSAKLTETGVAMGTPAYMSPEQALAEPVDARSDVFAFGIVFYEMLTGLSPFQGESRAQTFRKLIYDEPPKIADLASGVPPAVEAVARTCLEKDPARRYPDCAAVAAALRDASARVSAVSQAETVSLVPIRDASRDKRRRAVRAASLAALATAVVAGGGFWLHSIRAPATRQLGLAVLPFTNVSGDNRSQAFGLGLVMVVSSNLVAAGNLQNSFWIVSPGDVLQAHIRSAREARQLFGVDLVVTGSIEVSGENIRVISSLTDARTQRQKGTRQITRQIGDALKLEDDLAEAVAGLLQVGLPADNRNAIRSAGRGEPGAEDYYLQGRGYLQAGELEGGARVDNAVAEFQEALRRDPRFAAARAGLAAAELAQFQATKDTQWIKGAESDAAEALRLGGRTAEALTSLAAIDRAEGRYAESAAVLEEARRQDPRSAYVWKELAQTYEALERAAPAEDAYRKEVAIQPGNPVAHQDLGLFFYKQGRYQEAERSFERARELTPDSFTAWFRLGAVYAQTGRSAEAEAAYRHSLSLKPNGFSYNNLAGLYFDQERYAEAIPYMEKAVEIGPVNLGMLSNLARAYRRVPELSEKSGPVVERALALADKMLKVNPQNAAVHAELALLLAETGNRARAAKEIDAATSLATGNAVVLFRAVMTYEALGRRDDALRAWHELAKTGTFAKEIGQRPELKALRADPRFKGEK